MLQRTTLGSIALLTLTLAACGADAPAPKVAPAPPPATNIAPAPAPAPAASTPAPAPASEEAPKRITAAELAERVRQFAPAKLTADVAKLPPNERKALEKLVAAAKLMDPIFDRQAYVGNPALRAKLAADTSADAKAALVYFDIMRGPWDRQDHFRPFAIDSARPKGAGFYPEDLTADQLRQWIGAHPEDKKSLEGLTTIVTRDGGKLVAVPYGKAYAEWLDPAAALLVEASKLTANKTLATFLKSRAAAFKSDDYYQSDKDWMDLDCLVEITIGPYETYEDDLLGNKASFEAFVTVSDPGASTKLAKYKKLLPDMEAHLPVPPEVHAKRGAESPIRVVDLVYTSGDARKSVQTIAFNLPNDERVRAEKGAKKVLLRNIIETKFDVIMRPIAQRILAEPQMQYLSAEAFFNEVLFHELSHSLGPAFTKKDGKEVEVRKALESSYSAIEECKADVMGAYNILYMIKRGELPAAFREKLLTSYFAGLFRSTRFGVAEAHGQGSALQINRYIEEGAARFDEKSGRFTVDFPKLEASIEKLVHDLCILQHAGDKAQADALLAKYGVMSDPMKKAMSTLGDIPVDVRPIYPAAGE
jgi:hypothetical protein